MHSALPTPARSRRRTVAARTLLATATLVGGLWAGTTTGATAAHADDDYPYAGMGQCPLAPLPDSYLQAKREHERRVARQPQLIAAYERALVAYQKRVAARDAALAAAEQQRQDAKGKGKDKGGNQGPTITIPEVGPAPTPPAPVPPAPVKPPRTCAKNVWYVDGSMGDPWGFALRHCTSFVTWRLRETNGAEGFHNYLGGGHFSNAENWDDNARGLGYLVDDVPAVGSVAQTDDGVYGHVAWVSQVGDGTVTIEEYNHAAPGVYSTRTVPVSDFRYIHVEDVAPAPSRGSDRAVSSVTTAAGDTLSARVSDRGDLVVGGLAPKGRDVRLGKPGSLSPLAAPTLALAADGTVRLAAVARDGRLLVGPLPSSPGGAWRAATLGRGFAGTSSPALQLVDDRLVVVAVGRDGALRQRRTTSRGRWLPERRPDTLGRASAHTAPTLADDGEGVTWLVSVTDAGGIEARQADADSRSGWGEAEAVSAPAGQEWSRASTPAVTIDAIGRLRLHAVTVAGDLVELVRGAGDDPEAWVAGDALTGTWSPWSSPAADVDAAGRGWLAAVGSDGELVVRDTAPHSDEWRRPRKIGATDPTTSPALVESADELSLAADTRKGEHQLSRATPRQWQGGPRRSS